MSLPLRYFITGYLVIYHSSQCLCWFIISFTHQYQCSFKDTTLILSHRYFWHCLFMYSSRLLPLAVYLVLFIKLFFFLLSCVSCLLSNNTKYIQNTDSIIGIINQINNLLTCTEWSKHWIGIEFLQPSTEIIWLFHAAGCLKIRSSLPFLLLLLLLCLVLEPFELVPECSLKTWGLFDKRDWFNLQIF